MEKLLFVSKNWPSDLRIGCESAFSLVKFIDIYGDLKEELEEFEGSFERDEVVDLWSSKNKCCWLEKGWKIIFVH